MVQTFKQFLTENVFNINDVWNKYGDRIMKGLEATHYKITPYFNHGNWSYDYGPVSYRERYDTNPRSSRFYEELPVSAPKKDVHKHLENYNKENNTNFGISDLEKSKNAHIAHEIWLDHSHYPTGADVHVENLFEPHHDDLEEWRHYYDDGEDEPHQQALEREKEEVENDEEYEPPKEGEHYETYFREPEWWEHPLHFKIDDDESTEDQHEIAEAIRSKPKSKQKEEAAFLIPDHWQTIIENNGLPHSYIPRLAQIHAGGEDHRTDSTMPIEDLDLVGEDLAKYHALLIGGRLSPNEGKTIRNQQTGEPVRFESKKFKDHAELREIVEAPHHAAWLGNPHNSIDLSKVDTHFAGSDGSDVVSSKDFNTSRALSHSTDGRACNWCTRGLNWFNHYSGRKLIFRGPDKTKREDMYQYELTSGQLMDSNDRPVSHEIISQKFPELEQKFGVTYGNGGRITGVDGLAYQHVLDHPEEYKTSNHNLSSRHGPDLQIYARHTGQMDKYKKVLYTTRLFG